MTPVERDRELDVLRRTWYEAALGRGRMYVVSGEAGAGKTTLVQHFADHMVDGVRVLWGACDPLATPRPLGPVHDMAPLLTEETARQLREATVPHEIFAAVYEELRANPSLVVVDDLHWADQGTIDLLRYLLRRIESTGSLVIGTVRSDELGVDHPVRTLLGDVARSPRGGSMGLAPLSVEGITALAGNRDVDAGRLHQLTGGNPFFVTELLDHGADDLPATARDAILARTVALTDEAWDLLHLLVCAPEAIPDQQLAPLGIGVVPLRALHELGLIQRGPRGVSFRHDLCRLAIASVIPPGIEPVLHRRLLTALERIPGADPAVLTHHALGAGDAVAILRHSAVAGRAAARSGAHTQAAEFYARALERAVAAPAANRAELLEAVATEYYLLDRLDDAIAATERAMRVRAEAGDGAGMSADHHALAVYYWYNAERRRAEEHAGAAVDVLAGEELSSSDDHSVLGHALAMQAFLALHASDLQAARDLITRARCEADASSEPTIGVRVRLIEGLIGVAEGDAPSRDAMVRVLDRAGDDYDEVYSSGYSNLSFLDVEQRRFEEAGSLLERSIAMSVERDLPICRAWQIGARGRLNLLTGEWDAALNDADEVLTDRSAPLARFWPHLSRAIVGLRRHGVPGEDLDAAWRLAARYGERLRRLHAAAVVAEAAWLTGEDDGRLDECRALLAEPGGGLEWSRGELAVWLHRLGDGSPVDMTGIAEPHALELSGDCAAAAAAWQVLGAPYEQALASARSGDAHMARAAVDALDRLGADAVAAKVRSQLRADGISSVPARRRKTTRRHPAGLTARQEEVLRHMSNGLTNAELAEKLYISTKTVDHHVSAILTKLGVASRREAVRTARSLGLLD